MTLVYQRGEADGLRDRICYSTTMGVMDHSEFYCRDRFCEDHVLVFVEQGRFFVEQEGGTLELSEGSYLLLNKRAPHCYYFKKEIPSVICWMHLRGGAADSLTSAIEFLSPSPIVGSSREIGLGIRRGIELYREQTDDALLEHSVNILRLLHLVLKEVRDREWRHRRSAEEMRFRAAFEALLHRFGLRGLSLDGFCAEMHMSKFYFCHRFKSYYGESPMKHLNGLRLHQAAQLLLVSDMRVATVAEECGFSSAAYFSAAFGKRFGCSPEEYRRKRKE